jgi:hemoglobin-like flavoprotein
MDGKQIKLVQESFKKVIPIADAAAEIFYKELFEISPKLRLLFKGNMQDQGKKLMSTLAIVIAGLDKPDTIIPAAQKLAIKHVHYGVKSEDYTVVGNALLYTLKQGLGDNFNDELRQAWINAYKLLADVMKEAAYK